MEGSQQHPLSNRSLHPTVCDVADSIIGTLANSLHELYVVRASLLMDIGLRSTWVGKVSPFFWGSLANRAVNAISSIEEMFCDIMWLLAIVNSELWHKRRLPQIDLLNNRPALFLVFISNGCPGLCGSSFEKVRLMKWCSLLLFNGKCSPRGHHYCGAL